jgi:hypothetical protein
MTIMLLFITVCFLAFSNGANDNFKGVASLFGSGTTSYRAALTWATITTLAGSICALFLAQTLLIKFSGKGLAPDTLHPIYHRSCRRRRHDGYFGDSPWLSHIDHARFGWCANR